MLIKERTIELKYALKRMNFHGVHKVISTVPLIYFQSLKKLFQGVYSEEKQNKRGNQTQFKKFKCNIVFENSP